jgi:hypothetical protein
MAQKPSVSVDAIRDWEKNHTEPQLGNKIKIPEFLGYDPLSIKSILHKFFTSLKHLIISQGFDSQNLS